MMYDYDLTRFDEVFHHVYDTVAEKVGDNVAADNIEAILNTVVCVAYGWEAENA